MIITIARQCGCRGDRIGKEIGEMFEIPVYIKKTMLKLAKEKGILKEYPGFFEERETNVFLSALAEDEGNEFLHQTPGRILHTMFEEQNGVIIGRCGNYAFEKEAAVRIFLCDQKKNRVQQIMRTHEISRSKAEELVDRVDERRAAYHKYYTGQTWGMAQNYDLCVDMSKVSIIQLKDMVYKIVREEHII